jgi:hypothetical protein
MVVKLWAFANRNDPWQGDISNSNSPLTVLNSLPVNEPPILKQEWKADHKGALLQSFTQYQHLLPTECQSHILRCIEAGDLIDIVPASDYEDGRIGRVVSIDNKVLGSSSRVVVGTPSHFWSVSKPFLPKPAPPVALQQAQPTSSVTNRRPKRPRTMEVDDLGDETKEGMYVVAEITDHRRHGSTWEFLVRWEGFTDTTWLGFRDLKLNKSLHDYLKSGAGRRDATLLNWFMAKVSSWKQSGVKELFSFINEMK